ncbi:class I SAM-dependent methyltransferase [Clostridium sp. 19966]|uniref:class I SAM-dependent DNA methyltransferase n=1 Tax=Clostridium sp. 19966 TaxID=2768166 RepID=UPI0028DDF0F3|nr:class I SAM-dependent methyltransferase [Clostridium sp. 19966]MDT8718399.1 class I SAM-dependent methyltransferase [Clostridium sp. 19966]
MNFDVKAKNWDNDKRKNRAAKISEEMAKALPKDKILNAMEFGCGTGLISFNLKDKFNSIDLIDTSSGMIEEVKLKIQKNNYKSMKAYCVDITSQKEILPKYDLIYTSMVLHHIVDTEKIFKVFYELLNAGGYLYVVDLNEEDGSFHSKEKDFVGHNGFNKKDFTDKAAKIGFKNIDMHDIYEDKKLIGEKEIKYSLFLMTSQK